MAKESSQKQEHKVPMVRLSDGVQMPLLGFGTSGVKSERMDKSQDAAYEAIKCAIRCGYRFFDTAALYQNEELVGSALNDAIAEKLVRRDELFICTKLWNTAHKRRSVIKACRESLARLKLDYVDLYLIHWPTAYADYYEPDKEVPTEALENNELRWINPRFKDTGKLAYSDTHFTESWLGMEDVREAKLARSIGVSNFNHLMLDQIFAMDKLRFAPTVNQIELHPYLSQTKLVDYCKSKNVLVNAYCPLGAPGTPWLPAHLPNVIEDQTIKRLAKKYNKSPAQVILKYHLARGISPIPKSVTPHRILENFEIFDFELEAKDLNELLGLNRNIRYCINTAGEIIDDHPLYPFKADY